MLNFIFSQRGNVKINQLLNQEEGCTIEELLLEEEKLVVLCRGGSIPKLIEFVCQRGTLQKLIQYSVQTPVNPNNHDQTHKFPFFAADVLASNAMILQALLEGGWNNSADDKEESNKSDQENSDDDTGSGNKAKNSAAKNEHEMVQSALNSGNENASATKEQLVDTLDQDLEIDNSSDSVGKSATGGITQVGLKKTIKDAGKSATTAESPNEESKETDTTMATEASTKEPAEKAPKHDYSLMDSLSQFLYEDEDPLPILCGYFLKVMEQLLDKQKQMTLEYLLLHQEGKIFSGLLRHLDHHSLATLLIKLIEQQIQPEKKDKWDASDNSDLDIEAEQAENELSSDQKRMQAVLKEKSTMVVNSLIDMLSPKNTTDMHMTLNASQILTEFCENDTFFQLLTQKDTFKKIVQVVTSMDANAQNQVYALNFLTQIVTQFGEQENTFFKGRKDELIEMLMSHFNDLCYNCLIILRSGELGTNYRNQSGREVRKAGILRIRAIEHLRAILTVLSKRGCMKAGENSGPPVLGDALRKKIIETMLYMMRTFQFCSISHQQGLLVLNLIREVFDEDDLETMKEFVKTELEADKNFHFPSGKVTSRMNLGQICKIAFELSHLTQKQLDDQDSSEDEKEDQESIEKRSKLQSWFHFCNETVSGIEKTWNRKLENPEVTPAASEEKAGIKEEEKEKDHEQTIEEMFANFNKTRLSRSQSAQRSAASGQDAGLIADIAAGLEKSVSKDDVFDFCGEKKTGEFGDNQFWKAPDQYDVDDLLADMDQ